MTGGTPVLTEQETTQRSPTKPVPSLAAELPGMLLFAGAAALGAAVTMGGNHPELVAVAPFGGIGLAYAARRPLLAVIIMVVIEVTNVSAVLAPSGGIPFFQASLGLGILAVAFGLRDPEARRRLNPWVVVIAALLAIYGATQAVATLGSVEMSASMDAMHRFALDSLFIMLMVLLIQLTGRPWAVAGALVIPLAFLSILCAANEFAFGGTQSFGGFATVTTASGEMVTTLRYGGPLPDSNFWGRHLVMALPLACALLTKALRDGRRLAAALWIASLFALFLGVYLTQSRGTFLAAGVAIVVWFVASEKSIRRRGLKGAPLALLAFMMPGVGNRLIAAVSDVKDASGNANVDPSVLGRLSAQQEAWAMFGERPIFGWGPFTFPGQVINFAGRVPIAVREPTNAPHNLYAEFAAESGINGLLGWAILMAGLLTVCILSIVAHPKSRDRVLAAAVCAGLIAWSSASVGLHLTYFRTLGVVFALVAGIAPEWPVTAETFRTFRRGLAIWATSAALGAVVGATCLMAGSSPAYTALQRMVMLPVGWVDGDYSYALDILSRREFLPTFAALMADPDSPVVVTPDPVRGVLEFEVTEPTAGGARDQVQSAIQFAESRMHASIGYQQYRLAPAGSMTIEAGTDRPTAVMLLAAALGGGVAIGGGMALSRRARRQQRVGRHARSRKWGFTSV
jgi:O-antigen ligase